MDEPAKILVVDDDPMFCQLVTHMLLGRGISTQAVHSADAVRGNLDHNGFAAVVLDWQLGEQDGLSVLQQLNSSHPTIPVILATATCSTDLAVSAIRLGAFDFLTKPLDEARLIATITRAIEQHRLLNHVSALEAEGGESVFEGIIGASPLMRTVFRAIQNIAPAEVSVMITGETGTGKELVSRAIHRRSQRSQLPFVALNMAALPKELVEATLFGHEKGAFTGADRRRQGAVEEAAGGTLFLDEIAEMPLDLQSKLLRFLQDRSFRRVGGAEEITADVRIVSATNCDPLEQVRNGSLRADLYYRLNVVPISLPPLRERAGDVALIAMHCVAEFSRKYNKSFVGIDDDALKILARFGWPGNVRELRHVIERIVILNDAPRIRQSMLPIELVGLDPAQADTVPATNLLPEAPTREMFGNNPDQIVPISELERQAIINALAVCGGSAQQAAARLGMSTATIYRKIKEYRLQTTRG